MSEHVAALDALFAAHDRASAPGLVVGVARHGRLLYRRAFGMASLEHAVANTPATRMRIGSASKHFACLAALLLAEEGKLDVHAPAGTLLPELPPLRGMPTLRQFMDHTSGYRCYLDLASNAAGLAMQPAGRALAAQVRQRDVNFVPGQGQLYCNGGYHLLSIAIERAAGVPFEQVLRTRLFEPLGLVDTDSLPSDLQMLPRMATLHVPAPGGGWRRGLFPTEEVRGEGAMVSTVDDMLKWLAHLRAPSVFGNDATWREMVTPATLPDGSRSTYGCGLWRHAWRGLELVHHSGSVYGGACQLLTVPAHGLDIVILSNGAPVSPVELGKKIVETVLAEHLDGPAPRMAMARRFPALIGTRWHSAETGLVLGFDAVGSRLGVSLQGSPAAPIVRDEGSLLRVGFEDVAMGPFVMAARELRAAGRYIDLVESGMPVRYRRLPVRAPSARRAGAALLGGWHSPELDAQATIAFEGDALTMRLRGPAGSRALRLTALASDVFVTVALDDLSPDRAALTLERGRGAVRSFRFASARTRGLRFERIDEPS